jgi:hypothetical protein
VTIRYLPWITRDMVIERPAERFVFGDNIQRIAPNAIGIATLYAPGRPYRPGCEQALDAVVFDLRRVSAALMAGRIVNVPADGVGTGIAALHIHAPDLHRLICAFFRAASGHCPWET